MKHQVKGKIVETLRKTLSGFMGEAPNVIEMAVEVGGIEKRPVFSLTTPELKEAGIVIKLPKVSLKPETSKVSVVWDTVADEGLVMTITELEHFNKAPKGNTPDVRPAKQGMMC